MEPSLVDNLCRSYVAGATILESSPVEILLFAKMMNSKRPLYLGFILAFFAPTAVYADGVAPILNFFHKDTWLPASIVTLVIVLLESILLRWRIRSIPFSGIFWRSFLLNAASSLTGSGLVLAFSRDSYFMSDTMSLVPPLFLITLLTEIPLLHFLFKIVPLTWKRAVLLGCGINIASYAAVFLLEIGVFSGWLSYAGHLDKQDLGNWNNPSLLKQLPGRIFATESVRANHGLRVYDPQKACWTSFPNCPLIDPEKWDVKGSTFAFVKWTSGSDWDARKLVVARLPAFLTVLEFSPRAFSDSQFDNWQGVTAVAVSPDEKKLAFLFRITKAVAPKDSSSYFDLGSRCKLIVIDLLTGREMTRAGRWASDRDICWLSDSRRILFSSFDDEALYHTTQTEVPGGTSYGIGHARDGRFKRSLYEFDVETGKIAQFSNGDTPSLAVETGDILVRDQNGLVLMNSSGKPQTSVDVRALGFRGAVVSPQGDMILAEIQRHVPFYAGGRLVLMKTNTPKVCHVLDDGLRYKVVWTAGEGGKSNQGSHHTVEPLRGHGVRHYLLTSLMGVVSAWVMRESFVSWFHTHRGETTSKTDEKSSMVIKTVKK